MKARILSMLCLALALVAFGCDKSPAADEAPEKAGEEAPADDKLADDKEAAGAEQAADEDQADEAQEDEALAKVEVAEAGSKFDPAVQAEQLPAGAWYCDMGTVHWAGTQKPEGGSCPECGMKLKQHDPEGLAAQKEKAVEADEHADHAHGEEGHAHGEEGHAHGEEGHAHGDDHGHAH